MMFLKGYTTIEYFEKRGDRNEISKKWAASSPYDMGTYRNLQRCLGPIPLFWLLPVNLPTVIETYYPELCNLSHPFVLAKKCGGVSQPPKPSPSRGPNPSPSPGTQNVTTHTNILPPGIRKRVVGEWVKDDENISISPPPGIRKMPMGEK